MVETDETILGGSKTYYTEPCTSMNLKGITTTTRTIRCTSCGRSHEDWNHFWKCPKYKPIWKKLINLMNETEIAEESGKTHDYTQEWV